MFFFFGSWGTQIYGNDRSQNTRPEGKQKEITDSAEYLYEYLPLEVDVVTRDSYHNAKGLAYSVKSICLICLSEEEKRK